MKKMVVLEPLAVPDELLESLVQDLLGDAVELTHYAQRAQSDAEMIERAKDAEIVVIANQPMSEDVARALDKVELLAVAFTGFDHLPVDVFKDKGVTICNASGYSNEAVTDLVFGMVISLLRRIPECDAATRKGGTKDGLVGQELSALRFGVIGAGAIGQQVLKVAAAFGCDCVYFNRSQKDIPNAQQVDLDTLLTTSDVISVHLPANAETKGFIDQAAFEKMKSSAIFVNCARGPIVDMDALAKALKEHQIGAAAIDVFYTEPPLPTDHVLFDTPNTLLTPHVAFATDEAFVKRLHIVVNNVKAFLDGTPTNVI